MISTFNNPNTALVRWRPLLCLALLQAAITLMWVVYNAYLIQLLAKFGFPKEWGIYLLVIESLVSSLFEPTMGLLSDRSHNHPPQPTATRPSAGPAKLFKPWFIGRFPLIAIGVIATAAFFLATPLIAVGSNLQTVAAWVLPMVIILWALCMSVFQSPAFALIGEYAYHTKLPQATSIIMTAAALVRIFSVAASKLILSWGPIVAFAISSACLLTALFALTLFHPNNAPAPSLSPSSLSFKRLASTFLLGCGVGVAGRSIGTALSAKFFIPEVSFLLVWFLIQGIAFIPTGILLERWGLKRILLGSLGITGLTLLTLARHSNSPILFSLTIILGITVSFIFNATLPFACEQVPPRHTGLGIGMYFSGAAMAGALFGLVIQFTGKPSPESAAVMGAVGILVAIVGVSASLNPSLMFKRQTE